MKDFKGKLVYITGGSSGIGLCLARILCARGARILLCARNEKKLLAAKKEIEKSAGPAGGPVMTLPVDVSNPRDVGAKMKRAVKDYGAPDILVNSAGINTQADRLYYEGFLMNAELYGMLHQSLDFAQSWRIKGWRAGRPPA